MFIRIWVFDIEKLIWDAWNGLEWSPEQIKNSKQINFFDKNSYITYIFIKNDHGDLIWASKTYKNW